MLRAVRHRLEGTTRVQYAALRIDYGLRVLYRPLYRLYSQTYMGHNYIGHSYHLTVDRLSGDFQRVSRICISR